MSKRRRSIRAFVAARAGGLILLIMGLCTTGFFFVAPGGKSTHVQQRMSYREAGLAEREAAVHLLNRFTFGPRPGDVERVLAMGLEEWFEQQLDAAAPDDALEARLPALGLSAVEIARIYRGPGAVLRLAAREGKLSREDYDAMTEEERRAMVQRLMEEQGLRPQRELLGALIGQKLLRAVYSENQLAEVLTAFWFNHFNVAVQDPQARPYVLAYERDAIRPHVLGSFRALLGATARHPAMLFYLDNAGSTAADSARTTMDLSLLRYEEMDGVRGRMARRRIQRAREKMEERRRTMQEQAPEQFRPERGINENYARELMELHTLGVDGGYTQRDVVEVARAFTGWTVLPSNERGEKARERIERRGERAGFLIDGAFLFRADAHDAGEKDILGHHFPAGGGMEEGGRVLDLLAAHPATARHISRKLAVHFVSDDPPEALVDDLTDIFLETEGDLRAMMEALAYSPYFWETPAAKVKSPFELTVSAVRALDAEMRPTRDFVKWIDKMGQPLYRYEPPTGFADTSGAWISAGTLLNRMNFGMHLAQGNVPGVRVDLRALTEGREPASVEEALLAYARVLLPAQDPEVLAERLLPMALHSDAARRIDSAAFEADAAPAPEATADLSIDFPAGVPSSEQNPMNTSEALARVVGVILGSPAFQRQ